jgi:Ca2+-binding EF-hand superfamily protein
MYSPSSVFAKSSIYTKSEEECDILEAFKVLDKEGTGKISVRDFRRCMTTLGDKMADEDVEEILLQQIMFIHLFFYTT